MVPTTTSQKNVSSFLEPGHLTKASSLAILQLSRDNFLPVYLQDAAGEHDGYAEGAVINTRYGSYPHSTMIGVPWGSQIRASKVDTGSRGRKKKPPTDEVAPDGKRKRPADDEAGADNRKRKRTTDDQAGPDTENATPIEPETREATEPTTNGQASGTKQTGAAPSGFIHVLPPTPEIWTMSLPHRTQVVYTPDYSYILHRIRARPGSVLIEAGAGSGSFSHASIRAVYNGYPKDDGKQKGKVFSYEYHEQRFHKMQKEIQDHGLDGLVHLTHRDVYNEGFLVDGKSPGATAIFLDLPSPWEALPHLSRWNPQKTARENGAGAENGGNKWVSPLNSKKNAYLCTFSPCIEQVTRTVSALRRLGWVDIDMVEIANRKLHTVRDRIGINLPVDRGVNNSPKDVEEALGRLTHIEERLRESLRPRGSADDEDSIDESAMETEANGPPVPEELTISAHPWMDGRLVTRGEPEIKTHTSYLVFAVLPREWTEEDEAAALAKYPVGQESQVVGTLDKVARKKERRELLQKQGSRKARRKERAEKMDEASGGI